MWAGPYGIKVIVILTSFGGVARQSGIREDTKKTELAQWLSPLVRNVWGQFEGPYQRQVVTLKTCESVMGCETSEEGRWFFVTATLYFQSPTSCWFRPLVSFQVNSRYWIIHCSITACPQIIWKQGLEKPVLNRNPWLNTHRLLYWIIPHQD